MPDDSGSTHVSVASIFHYLRILFAIIIIFLAIVGGGIFYIEAQAPVPKELVYDTQLEYVRTCLSTVSPSGTIRPGIFDAEKLTRQGLENCFLKNPYNIVGLRLSQPQTQSQETLYFLNQGYTRESPTRFAVVENQDGTQELIRYEVLFNE